MLRWIGTSYANLNRALGKCELGAGGSAYTPFPRLGVPSLLPAWSEGCASAFGIYTSGDCVGGGRDGRMELCHSGNNCLLRSLSQLLYLDSSARVEYRLDGGHRGMETPAMETKLLAFFFLVGKIPKIAPLCS